jgi:hypothetical protein
MLNGERHASTEDEPITIQVIRPYVPKDAPLVGSRHVSLHGVTNSSSRFQAVPRARRGLIANPAVSYLLKNRIE